MIKIRKTKKRKNPNLKGEEFIDDKFIDLLFKSIVYNDPRSFQEAMTYKNIGQEYCEDCTEEGGSFMYYQTCTCEDYLDDYNISNQVPSDHRNYYGIYQGPEQNLIDAVQKQFKYLSFPQLIKFRTKLINIDYSNKNDSYSKLVKIHKNIVKDIIKEINHIISKRK